MSARRIIRLAAKRTSLRFLSLVAIAALSAYIVVLIFGQGFILSTTETSAETVFLDGGVAGVVQEITGPLNTRPPVSHEHILPNHSSKKQNASRISTSVVNSRRKDKTQQNKTQTEKQDAEAVFLQRMAGVQKARHDLLRERCADTYNITEHVDFRRDRAKILSWKKLYEHAYANDDFKFIICRVLKVGSFSWRKVIRSLWEKGSPAFKRKQSMGDYAIREYDDDTFLTELEDYRKILFVREPFARLLSGYRDKYVELRHFPYYKPIGAKIVRAYRKGASRREIKRGLPTFEEFVRWLVSDPDDREGDYHWRPLFDWYHPCEMQYDYIGKLETASEDAKYIFKMLGLDKLETYPSTETHHQLSSARAILKQFYSEISPELLPKLIYRYREEFVLFNYTVPEQLSDIWS